MPPERDTTVHDPPSTEHESGFTEPDPGTTLPDPRHAVYEPALTAHDPVVMPPEHGLFALESRSMVDGSRFTLPAQLSHSVNPARHLLEPGAMLPGHRLTPDERRITTHEPGFISLESQ